MKSGPTLNGAVRRPARRSAPIKPVATVVFPLPDAGAAMTTAGTLLISSPHWRACANSRITAACRPQTRTLAQSRESPLDSFLALAAGVHRVLDLRHLGDEIGGVQQRLGSVAAGDYDVLGARALGQRRDDLLDVDPAPLQRIGELVEHVEVVALLGRPARDLRPSIGR